ncbi:flagellar basal-body MS-ring/collar protein FliF [Bacillus andreraoultii]|uniref:flagellar basal-body MS-ring/collar protein FliF n=1 Tax=Bacillus andreraoultii TaxID=1499685 RepID=UPI00053B7296|nr:flagellar basal-body MS-ring/collar protein FliF [Bacillus andreraoultii]
MKERLQNLLQKLKNNWQERTKSQKSILVGSIILFIAIISVLIVITTKTTMVPLYSNLTPAETGSIKEALDAKGIKSELADGGTTIKVPEESVDTLLVELAAEGIPKSGSIDYSFFSENAGLGMTDKEFDVMKIDAMQTEISNLIKNIDGIKDASVMITLPDKGIFVKDQTEEAQASIVLTTEPGYEFSEGQIKALYTLVSKSVPNLPTDNIVIMDQNFEYFDLNSGNNSTNGTDFQNQYAIKKEIERDLQRQVQSMLGTLMGQDKVVVSVTADIDFTQESREENLVEPVDDENVEGIAVSAKHLSETYTGENASEGGVPQAEDNGDTLTGYAEGTNGNGDYEKKEDTINYEVNKIRKQIVESPYKIRDLGIQVIVEPPDAKNPNSVSADVEEGIQSILSTIVRTSIDKTETNNELTDQDINSKVAVTFQPLLGKTTTSDQSEITKSFPLWGYILIGVLVVLVIVLGIIFLRKRKDEFEPEEVIVVPKQKPIDIPDVNKPNDTEEEVRKKQIEKMAKERPDEFAKLIRTWLSQD